MNSATGFLMDVYGLRPAGQERKETARFPGRLSLNSIPCLIAPTPHSPPAPAACCSAIFTPTPLVTGWPGQPATRVSRPKPSGSAAAAPGSSRRRCGLGCRNSLHLSYPTSVRNIITVDMIRDFALAQGLQRYRKIQNTSGRARSQNGQITKTQARLGINYA
jgi:hypothetical protein